MKNRRIWQRLNTGFTVAALLIFALPVTALAQPILEKAFNPDTIGPGSASTLTFTITNDSGAGVTDLAFTDVLPAGMALATPSSPVTDCTNGVVSAPDGGGTINLSAGTLGDMGVCTVSVNVVGTATATNTSGDLTSSPPPIGIVDPPSASLTVDPGLPGLSKSFSPTSIPLGGTSVLTLTVDNTAAGSVDQGFLSILDILPVGMQIGNPANASTDCGSTIVPPTFTAISGTNSILLSAFGFLPDFAVLASGDTCTISVDVTTDTTGVFVNTTRVFENSTGKIGFATAALDVPIDFLVKTFTDDPVPPGGTVNLQFTITNLDRDFPASAIAFDDDLDSVITGLAPAEVLPKPVCGGILDFTSGILSFSGGSLPAAGNCTFDVSLDVPLAATPGTHTNTTEAVTATIDGSLFTGNTATDKLVVNFAPVFTKEFLDDPVGAGDSVMLRFSITNTSPDLSLTEIAFTDFFNDVIRTASAGPTSDCGGTTTFTPPIDRGIDGVIAANLTLTGGSLGPGASCTIDITLDVFTGATSGIYPNTTSDITGVIESAVIPRAVLRPDSRLEAMGGGKSFIEVELGVGPVAGIGASDDLVVVGAPKLLKSFIDDPVQPGDTVNLEFTLSHDPLAPADATGITFTDDLAAVLTGLTANLPTLNPDPPCGPGSTLTGSPLMTFAGGTLAPGETCVFSVTLNVPADAAAGSHTNTTSSVVATVDGLVTTGNQATDDLRIAGLVLSKEFIDDPVLPGADVTLKFTIDNTSPTEDATSIFFSDVLSFLIPGLSATTLPGPDPCGSGSSLTGAGSLTFTGGNLLAGESCSFEVTLTVPPGTASNTYTNTTSNFLGFLDGTLLFFDNATDKLVVTDRLLFLTKEFIDDPVIPGSLVTLEFTLTNLDAANAITNIGFTDDLDAGLTGLEATVLPPAGTACNGGTLSGTDLLTFTGGSLAAGASCTFSATLTVPSSAVPGKHTNQSSAPTGTIGGLGVTGDPAIDDLVVNSVTLSKSFDGPTTSGGTPTMSLTLVNGSAVDPVANLTFNDDLTTVLAGLEATNLPIANACGPGSAFSGTDFLTLTGGNLLPGGSCTIEVNLAVPAGSAIGDFTNTTSTLTQLGIDVGAAASADLTILGTIGGAVSGLAGSGLELQNSGGDDLMIAANGSFTFDTPLPNGSPYLVTVKTPPTNLSQTCTVINDNGNLAGADVTNVTVDCVTNKFTVGGNVNGLAGSGLKLNNGTEDLLIAANGSFTFPTSLDDGSPYSVTVVTQPTALNQTCTVAMANGNLAGSSVTDVVVTCATETYTVGGDVSDLAGSGLELQNNGGDDLMIAADGGFTFASPIADGSPYLVTVKTQPTSLSQTCTVTNGSGSIAGADITDVEVTCVTDTFTVGGNVNGLTEPGLVLNLGDGTPVILLSQDGKAAIIKALPIAKLLAVDENLAINSDGPFAFLAMLPDGSSYAVTIKTQPANNLNCSLSNGGGVIAGNNVLNVLIACVPPVATPIPSLNRTGLLILAALMLMAGAWVRRRKI